VSGVKLAHNACAPFQDLMMPLVFPMVYPRATGWLHEDEGTSLDG
jgi:hypothetical protein